MPRIDGEDPFAVEPVERVGVGMADARRHDLDQDFALLRAVEIDLDDLERLLRLRKRRAARVFMMAPPVRRPLAQQKRLIHRHACIVVGRVQLRRCGVGLGTIRSASRSAPWRRPDRIPDGIGRRSPGRSVQAKPRKG
jgi:hypothetical protein